MRSHLPCLPRVTGQPGWHQVRCVQFRHLSSLRRHGMCTLPGPQQRANRNQNLIETAHENSRRFRGRRSRQQGEARAHILIRAQISNSHTERDTERETDRRTYTYSCVFALVTLTSFVGGVNVHCVRGASEAHVESRAGRKTCI